MLISKRKYYCNVFIAYSIIGVLILISIPLINNYFLHIESVNKICKTIIIMFLFTFLIVITLLLIKKRKINECICRIKLKNSVESNLLGIGAYEKIEGKNYVIPPKIKVSNDTITIALNNLKIRNVIEKYIDSFSTALPEQYVVEDYFISQNNANIIIKYENISNYIPESYSIDKYIDKINSLGKLDIYFDKKHIVNLNDYPHFLISGNSGSGKSYLSNEIVIQAIIKGWDVVVCDIKRSYGMYKEFIDYHYEIDDILNKLSSVEEEMQARYEKLQPELDKNPRLLAVDIGFNPILLVVEEYISLQSSLDKKKKEELERIIKNISVLARQTNIHLMIVMQSAGTENIQSTTRSNLTKVLLGNAQSNIIAATYGTGVDIPMKNSRMKKGEGMIGLDRITVLRVPEIINIDDFNEVIGCGVRR